MSESQTGDSGLYELAPEEPVKPAERWVPPKQAKEDAKPLPCPQCRYDLRGLRSDICPECGLKLTYGARRRAQDLREGKKSDAWFDRKAVVMALIGLAVSALVMWFRAGATGLVVFGIDFVFTVVVGWLVFFVCSIVWIGFDQPLRTTVLQTIGAFGFFAGVAVLLNLVPLPGLITSLIAFAVLAGVLSDLLELDFQDAAIIALFVTVFRIAFWATVLFAMVS